MYKLFRIVEFTKMKEECPSFSHLAQVASSIAYNNSSKFQLDQISIDHPAKIEYARLVEAINAEAIVVS